MFQQNCPCCGQPLPENDNENTFTAFWSQVQHKVNKAGAEKAWRKLTAADRKRAHDAWPLFWASWQKTNPQASPIHPATYLNNRRWHDETTSARVNVTPEGRIRIAAQAIQSGKPFLCTNIPAALARDCVAAGLVTPDQCKAVGVL